MKNGGSTLTEQRVTLESAKLAQRIAAVAAQKGAEGTVILDMRSVVSYTDFLIICTGQNERQTKAIHDQIYAVLKNEDGLLPAHREGLPQARWILLDYFTAVVHILTPQAREYYCLEQLWEEAQPVALRVTS